MTRTDVGTGAGRSAQPESSANGHRESLEATASWLEESIAHGKGGSCAYFSPATGWSKPYPETTGYVIPTLLALSDALHGFDGAGRAEELGSWLISVQSEDGWWASGTHPPRGEPRPSVFNTAQILQGMVALYDASGEDRWLAAAQNACEWLTQSVDRNGLWSHRDYRAVGVPSYYTYAAWPMLMVAKRTDDGFARNVAQGVLQTILERRRPNGTFAAWGFEEGAKAAYTHTIAYTFQGLIESAKLLEDWETFGQPAEQGLLELAELAQKADGRLPGRIDDEWQPAARYVCLTGNAQLAGCLLDLNDVHPAPDLPAAALQLVNAVCDAQHLRGPLAGIRGAVGGSSPLWGRYMMLRYPNWAAKYHCDILLRIGAGVIERDRVPN